MTTRLADLGWLLVGIILTLSVSIFLWGLIASAIESLTR